MKYHTCKRCFRPLPDSYPQQMCPNCLDDQLFSMVRDYIRKNDVTEYNVAEHFNIPLSKVKHWIREGRIEYKTIENRISITHCERCGTTISFGTLCTDCMKLLHSEKKGVYIGSKNKEDKWRFWQ